MTQMIPSHPCLLAGDFNLKHPAWQSSARPSLGAEPFLSYSHGRELSKSTDELDEASWDLGTPVNEVRRLIEH